MNNFVMNLDFKMKDVKKSDHFSKKQFFKSEKNEFAKIYDRQIKDPIRDEKDHDHKISKETKKLHFKSEEKKHIKKDDEKELKLEENEEGSIHIEKESSEELHEVVETLNEFVEALNMNAQLNNNEGVNEELEGLKEEIKEIVLLLNTKDQESINIQNDEGLKEKLLELVNKLDTILDKNQIEDSVKVQEFDHLLSEMKNLLKQDIVDQKDFEHVSGDISSTNPLGKVHDPVADIKTDETGMKDESLLNFKMEENTDEQNSGQMENDHGKQEKGFLSNHVFRQVDLEQTFAEITPQGMTQNNIDFVQNMKTELDTIQKPNFTNMVEQVIEKAEVLIHEKGAEMSLKLKPESLGNLSMKIAVERGIVVANIVVENQVVKEVLESNFNALKDALNEKGFGIGELNVNVGQDSNFKQQQNFMNSKKKNNRQVSMLSADYDDLAIEETEDHVLMDDTMKINQLG